MDKKQSVDVRFGHTAEDVVSRKEYICVIADEFVVVTGFSKSDAYSLARTLGYNGKLNDIRLI